MAKDKAINIGFWTLLFIFIFVVWPICAYALYILHQNWNESYFVRRRRNAICVMLILCCVALFISLPLTTIINILYDSPADIPASFLLPCFIPTKFSSFACTMLLMARPWLYYYDIHYSKEMSSKEWKVLINQCVQPGDWFTVHKHTFGCHNWWLRRIFIITTIILMIYCLLFITVGDADIFAFTVHASLTITAFIIWHKYPKFNDMLGIRNELKKILLVWGISIMTIYGTLCIMIIAHLSWNGFMVAAIFVLTVNSLCVVYYTIIDVYNQHKHNDENQRWYQHMQSNSNTYAKVKVKSWKPIVSRMDGYELFMDHLQKEFSIENLLFITEYSQLKTATMKMFPDHVNALKDDLPWTLSLPSSDKLPISCIVYCFTKEMKDNHTDTDVNCVLYAPFISACCKIYDKYINAGHAPFQVNISSVQRYGIAQVFENEKDVIINENETLKIVLSRFESAVLAIQALMTDSFSRFKRTEIAKEYWLRYMEDQK